jgi:hypothetical protein
MQLYSLGTGSILMGAVSMLVFALGTVPLMFAFGALSALLNSRFARVMGKVSAVLIIVIGFVMLGRGFGLSGVALPSVFGDNSSRTEVVSDSSSEENVQRVTTTFTSGDYLPITVREDIPVVWTIHVSERDLNGCNNQMTIPTYGIVKKLVPGDNIIEFTPADSGVVAYSCWMGMIRSTIKVKGEEDRTEQDPSGQQPAATNVTPLNSPDDVSSQRGCCLSASTESADDVELPA